MADLNAIAAVLGYITMLVGAAVLGSAGLAFIQSISARLHPVDFDDGCDLDYPAFDEPVKIRLKRVKAENFAYHMNEEGHIDEAWETNDTGQVIAHVRLPDVNAYANYQRALQIASNRTGLIPHCDSNILHAPGECRYCDDGYPDLQEFRALHLINFTGQHDPNKLTCPAEVARRLEDIELWGGNRRRVQEFEVERNGCGGYDCCGGVESE